MGSNARPRYEVFADDVVELPLLLLSAPSLVAKYEGSTDEHKEPDEAKGDLGPSRCVGQQNRDCPSPKKKANTIADTDTMTRTCRSISRSPPLPRADSCCHQA